MQVGQSSKKSIFLYISSELEVQTFLIRHSRIKCLTSIATPSIEMSTTVNWLSKAGIAI